MRCSLPVAVFDRITMSLKFPTILISIYARFPINDSTSTIHKSFNGSRFSITRDSIISNRSLIVTKFDRDVYSWRNEPDGRQLIIHLSR